MCAESSGGRAVPLYLMAKAPVAGAVKTRMRPQLGPDDAVRLARLMLERSVANACRHWPGEVALCVWPDPDHPDFTRLAGAHRLAVTAQTGADLGARMMSALRRGLARAGAAAVMGCDVPHCGGEILARAHALLAGGENPLGPCPDGGFYLLGLQRAAEARAGETLFRGVRWSGPAVRARVCARAAAAGVGFCQLPSVRDIDHYSDLEWLAARDDAYKGFVE